MIPAPFTQPGRPVTGKAAARTGSRRGSPGAPVTARPAAGPGLLMASSIV